jgi:peptidoglycan/xylan/chitin deacetylase (PgdA/CDA1 family)
MRAAEIKKWIKSRLPTPILDPISNYYQGEGTCLMYHRITDDKNYNYERDYYHHGMLTHRDNFELQIEHLSKHYHCLDISSAMTLLQQGKLPSKTVLVTFDDGYKDNLTLALPILKKYSVPATIYITTGFINRESILWWYEAEFIMSRTNNVRFNYQGKDYHWLIQTSDDRQQAIEKLSKLIKVMTFNEQISVMNQLRLLINDKFDYSAEFLTWKELQELDKEPLITIGAHTQNHPCMRILDSQTLMEELLQSKQLLEEKLQHPILHFAYPFGGQDDASTREYQAVEKAGFVSAMTTRFGHIHSEHAKNLFALPRIDTHYLDNLSDFIWKTSGWGACYRNKGRRVILL